MIKLEMKDCNMILIEKQQKYYHYYLEILINMNILQVKNWLTSDQRRVIEQGKFAYSPLGKALEKQRITIEEQGK